MTQKTDWQISTADVEEVSCFWKACIEKLPLAAFWQTCIEDLKTEGDCSNDA